jgi:hypothetical protein
MGIFRGSKGERLIAYALLEVTSPEAALTGNGVTWSHVTGSDVITGSMFCTCPEGLSRAFFLTIAVVRNVQLWMTGSSMANACDINGNHVTGSDVIFPALCSYYSIVTSLPVTHTQLNAPLCSPEIFLELSRYTTLIFGLRGPYR